MRRPLLRPPPLEPGDLIGVFTPSTPAHVLYREKYLHGIAQLESLGFRVLEGPLTARMVHQGYRSGTGEERAAELMSLVENPHVRGVIATIGGMNSSSMIPHLDFQAIRSNPKVICGYSDVTSLHLAVLAYSGLCTFYGPAVMPSFGEWPRMLPETRDSFLDAVQRHRSGVRELLPPKRWSNQFRDAGTDAWKGTPHEFRENAGWRVLSTGTVSAPVIVANLNTLLSSAGTPHFPELEDKILLVEEMSAPWALQERSFRHLHLLGVYERIAGLIVGKPWAPDPQGAPFTYEELLMEVVGVRPYPILSGFDCGHTVPMLTLGQEVQLTIEAEADGDARVWVDAPAVAA